MCGFILLFSLVLVFAEFTLLVELGAQIGAFQTVGLAFLTAAVGLWAARDQGMAAMERIRASGGALPRDATVLDGPLVALAALFLLIPGFITDTVGALLLVPPLRRLAARALARRMPPPGPPGPGGGRGPVIVVRRVDEGDGDDERP